MMPSPVAIDGPAASGKTTVGRALAELCGYLFLDTGAMYRAFTLAALRRGIPASDARACGRFAAALALEARAVAGDTRVFVEGEDVTGELRSPDIEANVSRYSAIAEVRAALVRQQRAIAAQGPAILAGRDIGTVVLPDAPVKIFLDATPEARGARRGLQAGQSAEDAGRDVRERDRVDSTREVSPLQAAPDAVRIDTTGKSIEEVLELVLECLRCAAG